MSQTESCEPLDLAQEKAKNHGSAASGGHMAENQLGNGDLSPTISRQRIPPITREPAWRRRPRAASPTPEPGGT